MKRQRKVELLPQLLESIANDSADVYVLFVDLCGSTQFKQDANAKGLSEIYWISRQLIFLQRVAELIKKYRGIIVKTIGDEVFAYFDATTHPEAILKCAIEIIQSFENLKAFKGSAKIEAKASIDYGLTFNGSIVNTVSYDPIGTPVDRCARFNALAKNNEIIFSVDFQDAMGLKAQPQQLLTKYGYQSRKSDLKGFGLTDYYLLVAK